MFETTLFRGFGGGEGKTLLAWWEGNRGAQASPTRLRLEGRGAGSQQEDGRPGLRKDYGMGGGGSAESQEHGSQGFEAWVLESKTSSPLGFPTSPQPVGKQGDKPRQDVHSSDSSTLPSHTRHSPRAAAPLGCMGTEGLGALPTPPPPSASRAERPSSSGDFPAAVVRHPRRPPGSGRSRRPLVSPLSPHKCAPPLPFSLKPFPAALPSEAGSPTRPGKWGL